MSSASAAAVVAAQNREQKAFDLDVDADVMRSVGAWEPSKSKAKSTRVMPASSSTSDDADGAPASLTRPSKCRRCMASPVVQVLMHPKHGNTIPLLFDMFLFAIVFMLSFASEPMSSNVRLTEVVDAIGGDQWEAVIDYGTFLQFGQAFEATLFGSTMKDYNDEVLVHADRMFETNLRGAFGPMTTVVLQYRDQEHPTCKHPMIKAGDEEAQLISQFLRINCSNAHWAQYPFGYKAPRWWGPMARCPHFEQSDQILSDPFTPISGQHLPFPMETPDGMQLFGYRMDPNVTFDAAGNARLSTSIFEKLKECYWLDMQTREVIVAVLLFDYPNLTPLYSQYKVFFGPNGIVEHKEHKISYLQLAPSDVYFSRALNRRQMFVKILLSIWFITGIQKLVLYAFLLVRDLRRAVLHCRHTRSSCKRESFTLEGRHEPILNLLFIVVVINYIVTDNQRLDGTGRLWKIFVDMAREYHMGGGTTADVATQQLMFDIWARNQRDIINMLLTNVDLTAKQRTASVFVVLVYATELLRHFTANRHFSIVPRSLMYGMKDIAYLSVVLFTFVLCMASYMATVTGNYYEPFSSPLNAIVRIFNWLLGDFPDDFNEGLARSSEAPLFYILNFAGFAVIVIIVTVNIFLSIVLDAYAQVKGELEGEGEGGTGGSDGAPPRVTRRMLRSLVLRVMSQKAAASAPAPAPVEGELGVQASSSSVLLAGSAVRSKRGK